MGTAEQGWGPNQVPCPQPSSCRSPHRAQGSAEVAPVGAPSGEPGSHIPPFSVFFPLFLLLSLPPPYPGLSWDAMVDPMSSCNWAGQNFAKPCMEDNIYIVN